MRLAAALLISLCVVQSASADTIISNLASSTDAAFLFIGDNGSGFDIQIGMGFTTAAGSSLSLDNIVVRLKRVDASDDPLIRLFSDSTGPDSALVTFTDPANTAAVADHTLTPTSSFTLAPSTTYWIVMENLEFPRGAVFDWVGVGAAFTGTATFAGSSIGVGSPSGIDAPSTFLAFEVNATVPEPSTIALFGIGAIAVFGYGWRRKRAAA